MASMALSNKTLSGCFDPISASGFTDFLLVQAAVKASTRLNPAINDFRRNIGPLEMCPNSVLLYVGTTALGCPPALARLFICALCENLRLRHAPALPQSPPSAAPRHSFLDRRSRTRRCPPPEFPPLPEPRRPRSEARRRHLLRCGSAARVVRVSPPVAAFCAAWRE